MESSKNIHAFAITLFSNLFLLKQIFNYHPKLKLCADKTLLMSLARSTKLAKVEKYGTCGIRAYSCVKAKRRKSQNPRFQPGTGDKTTYPRAQAPLFSIYRKYVNFAEFIYITWNSFLFFSPQEIKSRDKKSVIPKSI